MLSHITNYIFRTAAARETFAKRLSILFDRPDVTNFGPRGRS